MIFPTPFVLWGKCWHKIASLSTKEMLDLWSSKQTFLHQKFRSSLSLFGAREQWNESWNECMKTINVSAPCTVARFLPPCHLDYVLIIFYILTQKDISTENSLNWTAIVDEFYPVNIVNFFFLIWMNKKCSAIVVNWKMRMWIDQSGVQNHWHVRNTD